MHVLRARPIHEALLFLIILMFSRSSIICLCLCGLCGPAAWLCAVCRCRHAAPSILRRDATGRSAPPSFIGSGPCLREAEAEVCRAPAHPHATGHCPQRLGSSMQPASLGCVRGASKPRGCACVCKQHARATKRAFCATPRCGAAVGGRVILWR